MICDYEAKLVGMKKHLAKEFEFKKGIFMSQHKYVLDLLTKIGMLGCKPADTLMGSTKKIGAKNDSALVDGGYQRLVRRLSIFLIPNPMLDFLLVL